MADSRSVAEAMAGTPRSRHLPPAQVPYAHLDVPLPLFRGTTNSQPSTVRQMLEELEVPPGARVLDVGAGSGWTTAILASLVGSEGSVLGLELDVGLARWGAGRLAHWGRHWARLESADPDELGRAAEGPYDRILISAMAEELPESLVAQLAEEGRLVCPVAGQLWTVQRRGGDVEIRRSGAYAFVPLVVP